MLKVRGQYGAYPKWATVFGLHHSMSRRADRSHRQNTNHRLVVLAHLLRLYQSQRRYGIATPVARLETIWDLWRNRVPSGFIYAGDLVAELPSPFNGWRCFALSYSRCLFLYDAWQAPADNSAAAVSDFLYTNKPNIDNIKAAVAS